MGLPTRILILTVCGGCAVLQSRRLFAVVVDLPAGTIIFPAIDATTKVLKNKTTLNQTGSTVSLVSTSSCECSIIDESCLEELALSISRVWPYKSVHEWCSVTTVSSASSSSSTHDENNQTGPSSTAFDGVGGGGGGGLMLIKVPKSASSTAAAVVLRIQHRHHCRVRWKHGRAVNLLPGFLAAAGSTTTAATVHDEDNENDNYRNAKQVPAVVHDRNNIFLVAPVRAPESRALSSVYFHQISFHAASRAAAAAMPKTKTPADGFVLKHLNQIPSNYITDYVSLRQDETDRYHANKNNTVALQDYVRGIVASYDFFLVVDRMDESLVVLSLLTDVPIETMLTSILPSKRGGTWYYSGKQCIALVAPVVTAELQQYFQSIPWKAAHAADRLLYRAASTSLDRTIAAMDQPLFQSTMTNFQRLQTMIQRTCQNETYFPCRSDGTPQLALAATSCYARDFGCGYPCIDRTLSTVASDRQPAPQNL